MYRWQKHFLGLFLPLAVSATIISLTPDYDAPEWAIKVSVAGIIIAIAYSVFVYVRLASRGGNYFIVPALMFLIGAVGGLVGQAGQSGTLAALGGLVPLSGFMLLLGYCYRRSGSGQGGD
jgi:hypothetical protein